MSTDYDKWILEVIEALHSINMNMDDWHHRWAFDFKKEFGLGTSPENAALKANRYWWFQQNLALNQQCRKVPNCWLPRGHNGDCQPTS
jgi:hypothetical protein